MAYKETRQKARQEKTGKNNLEDFYPGRIIDHTIRLARCNEKAPQYSTPAEHGNMLLHITVK